MWFGCVMEWSSDQSNHFCIARVQEIPRVDIYRALRSIYKCNIAQRSIWTDGTVVYTIGQTFLFLRAWDLVSILISSANASWKVNETHSSFSPGCDRFISFHLINIFNIWLLLPRKHRDKLPSTSQHTWLKRGSACARPGRGWVEHGWDGLQAALGRWLRWHFSLLNHPKRLTDRFCVRLFDEA